MGFFWPSRLRVGLGGQPAGGAAPLDDVADDEEVVRQAHRDDDVVLPGDPLVHLRREPFVRGETLPLAGALGDQEPEVGVGHRARVVVVDVLRTELGG